MTDRDLFKEDIFKYKFEQKEGNFSSEGLSLKYSLFIAEKKSEDLPPPPGVLILHGASTSGGRGRVLFNEMQKYLAEDGFSSMSFDVRGVGESEGEYEYSTLEKRQLDSQNAIDFLIREKGVDSKRLALMGLSMGGHTAAMIASDRHYFFRALVLVNPAAYASEAEDKKLKPSTEFTEAIRVEDSWKSSRVFESITKFQGAIMFADSEHDDVIPREVKDSYYRAENLRHSQETVLRLRLPNIKHAFFSSDDENAVSARQILYKDLANFLNRKIYPIWGS